MALLGFEGWIRLEVDKTLCWQSAGPMPLIRGELVVLKDGHIDVVYLDQWAHAGTCIRMVENDKKHSKMMQKVSFPFMRRGSCKVHQEKRRKKFVGQRLGVTPKNCHFSS